ncbi:hypothetical protein FA13DRAFT_1722192 [Coprinellus micaceus]|uniref:F-box domain-containing protein n=1 Tax=Coprinellus micaceus TaxID=71717 RepID=A0A4Y7RP20_COPMI|nr:hypothetical protein FA13DRAFT_1722192 [Coprinellus micaceus]
MSLSMLQPPPSNSSINEDVWTVIGQCCDPRDLISLASTCRYLYRALETPTTWNETLKRVCELYGIMNGTYALSNMTLRQIKQASCRPRTWMKFVQRQTLPFHPAIRGPLPRLSRVVRLPLAFFDQMTPGGRFLIRVQEWGLKSTLEISRLPPPTEAHTIRSPLPIAQSCTTLDDVFVSVTWHDTHHNATQPYLAYLGT